MNIMIFFFLFIFYSSFVKTDEFLFHQGGIFYDMKELTLIDVSYLSNDFIDYHNSTPINDELGEIQDFVFNLARKTVTKCINSSIACIKFSKNTNYYPLTIAQDWNDPLSSNNISFYYDKTNHSRCYVQFSLPSSSAFIGKLEQKANVMFYFKCTESNNNLKYDIYKKSGSYNFSITAYSSFFCDYNFNAPSKILMQKNFEIGTSSLCIFIGLILLFFDLSCPKGGLFFSGGIFGFITSLFLIAPFTEFEPLLSDAEYLIGIITAAVIIIFGIIFVKFSNFGFTLIRAEFGIILWDIFYSIALTKYPVEYLYDGCMASGIIFAIASFFIPKNLYTFIVPSTFVGSFLLTRGISYFIGNYPNELIIYQQLVQGIFVSKDYFYFIYIPSIIVLGFGGFLIKKKQFEEYVKDEILKAYFKLRLAAALFAPN